MLNTQFTAANKQRGFGHGGLRLVTLKLISDQSRHGYDLIKAINALTAGHYRPSAGMVYPLLNQLVQQGLIQEQACHGDDKKKVKYEITTLGSQTLLDEATRVDSIFYRVGQRAKQPELVIQAIQDFKCAVRNKLTDQTFSPEQASHFAEILDHAVQQIKKL